ncbi:hypothetical protein F4Y93_10655 [Candidatus Poribacteria bacterium]|nr:hypothetical protein [Candidatus Poribacteria bacterium]
MNSEDVQNYLFDWWKKNVHDNNLETRGRSARLRNAQTQVDFLLEPCVHEMIAKLGIRDGDRACLIAGVLAHVEKNSTLHLARGLGQGKEPRMSQLRFQKLIRSPDLIDLRTQVRRSLPMLEKTCNVSELGTDLFFWGEKTQNRWCFEYFGTEEKSNSELEITE